MVRGFEVVEDWARKNNNFYLPLRSTVNSAGYDFFLPFGIILFPKQSKIIWTDIKVYMQEDEIFLIYPRSSTAIKKDTIIKNIIGVIDQDYYSNSANDGNIGIFLQNIGDKKQDFEWGEKIAQGIFHKYLIADNCNSDVKRNGGIGSTNQF